MAHEIRILENTHDVVKLNVMQSTAIRQRTGRIIESLTAQQKQKPVVVSLAATGKAAPKLISIVEIAKRDLASRGVSCKQYTAVSCDQVFVEKGAEQVAEEDSTKAEDDQDYFESMGPKSSDVAVRTQAHLTVFLSKSSIKLLRDSYGEQ
ncbi:hypothetical protein K470DRAFT_209055 [Piedraia hortae CBS 480.64]|uniref:DNA/RNA-binding protein Alba-like domain-containing protein n=1 Tax=Piedraia hortae CBS 480.64 TaxID=1314780 RepID=A0A6A7CAY1_9PEZI|nr:hypothetical protein K470DRAFT_209055 [Piedraia hortae CBS 480.64]